MRGSYDRELLREPAVEMGAKEMGQSGDVDWAVKTCGDDDDDDAQMVFLSASYW